MNMVSSMQSTGKKRTGSGGGQLLQELEALSEALYRTGNHQQRTRRDGKRELASGSSSALNESLSLFPPSTAGLRNPLSAEQSDAKRASSDGKLDTKPRRWRENPNQKKADKSGAEKKSLWDWKPLRALAHIGQQRFACQFSLRVHSAEGLPATMNGFNLCIHWRRREGGVESKPAKVIHGVAEFEETLYHECTVYGSRSGPNQGMRYDSKYFVLSVTSAGAEEVEFGKHRLDLSRMLPDTLEDFGAEEKSGRWTTNFKLAGKARGGVLVVTLGYKILDKELGHTAETSSRTKPSRSARADPRIGRGKSAGAVDPSGRRSAVRSSLDSGAAYSAAPAGLASEAPASIVTDPDRVPNLSLDHPASGQNADFRRLDALLDFKPTLKFFSGGEGESRVAAWNDGDDDSGSAEEDAEFSVVEKGVEIGGGLPSGPEDGLGRDSNPAEGDGEGARFGREGQEEGKEQLGGANLEEREEPLGGGKLDEGLSDASWIREEEEEEEALDSLLEHGAEGQRGPCSGQGTVEESSDTARSLDDVVDMVAGEFLSMLEMDSNSSLFRCDSTLEMDRNPSIFSSDSDPDSPRARLLKQFERESLLEGGGVGLGVGMGDSGLSFSSAVEGRGDVACGSSWDLDEEGLELASIVEAAESELQKATQTMRSKTRAKILEDAETEALMNVWGMDEKAFQSSPPDSSGGFGSPISLPFEEPLELPPLAEGLGPLVKTKDGGLLRSMNPSLFRNAKNKGSLIMQVSKPVVVPAEMGSSVMDILHRLASAGIEKLTVEARKTMPLEDITGKTIQQVAFEAKPALEGAKKRQATLQGAEVQLPDSGGMDLSEFKSQMKVGASGSKMSSMADTYAEFVSLEELAPLAMDKIEALSIEGLKIQSDMADEDAPSNVSAMPFGDGTAIEGTRAKKSGTLGLEGTAGLQLPDTTESSDNVDGLMGMTITLDEWMRLDAGIVNEEDTSDRTSKILAAHHAVRSDLVVGDSSDCKKGGKGRRRHGAGRWGFMGNTLTIALLVQLRDPLRNFEPVGGPMLALVQAERVVAPPRPNMGKRVSEKGNSEEVEEIEAEENRGEKKEESSQFKITEVHVAGMKSEQEDRKKSWNNPKQQQSGSRWLIASGMGKSGKHPMLKSKPVAKVMPPSKTKVKPGETLWSISSRVHGSGEKWKELAALNPHIRNPDIIFPNDTIRLR